MPFYVYILRCADGKYYTGHSDDLDTRLSQHGAGTGCAFTARRLPVELLWATDCQSRDDAFSLEKKIQGWSRAKKEALMAGRLDLLPKLARGRARPSTGSG